jgi:predicted NBD/HSP70 family sugar kinase
VRQLRKEKDISIEGIVSAFEKGDPVACKIMDEASSFLSIAVANVIKLLNPELVVLDRNFLRLGEKFLSIFLSGIRSHLLYGEAVRFDISNIGNDQAALGGAALTLQHFLKQGV